MWISRKRYQFLKENAKKNVDVECAIATIKENQRREVARAMEEYSAVLQERDALRLAISEFEFDDRAAARISKVVQQNAMTLEHCADVLETVAPYCNLWTTDGFLKRLTNALALYIDKIRLIFVNKDLIVTAKRAADSWRGTDAYHQPATIIDMLIEELGRAERQEGLDKCMPHPEKSDFNKGYQQALMDISKPMAVIAKNWNPSICPRCKGSFSDFEPCFDGYYNRATGLDRCPFCGQRLDWEES